MDAVSLHPKEYDFSGVPEEELEQCCFYEYARESETIINEARHFREQVAGLEGLRMLPPKKYWATPYKKSLPDIQQVLTSLISVLARCEAFPETTWQGLSERDRRKLSSFPDEIEEMAFYHQLETEFSTRFVLKMFKKGVFCLSKKPEHKSQVQDFVQWVEEYHPEYKFSENRGRGNYRDALNALGAMRLRSSGITLSQAQKLVSSLPNQEKRMNYNDRTAWRRACKNALRHFHDLLCLRPYELPIHWTEGWQKKPRV